MWSPTYMINFIVLVIVQVLVIVAYFKILKVIYFLLILMDLLIIANLILKVDLHNENSKNHEVTLLTIIFVIVLQVDRILLSTLKKRFKEIINTIYFITLIGLTIYRLVS